MSKWADTLYREKSRSVLSRNRGDDLGKGIEGICGSADRSFFALPLMKEFSRFPQEKRQPAFRARSVQSPD